MPFTSALEVEEDLKVTAHCQHDIWGGIWKMKIRGFYILVFNQSLAVHHLKYSYNYQNIFQVLFTTNVDHYVSTAKFIKIIPAVPSPVSRGCEKYTFVAHMFKSTSTSQKATFQEKSEALCKFFQAMKNI